MKIGIYSNQFDSRGTGKVPLEYAQALQKTFNHEIVMITSKDGDNSGLANVQKHFKVVQHDGSTIIIDQRSIVKKSLRDIVDKERLSFLYMVKAGANDNITPDNCKTGIHCVFHMDQPHGSVYAGVSDYLAKKYNQTSHVPHIIKKYNATKDIRLMLGIDSATTVVGRIGGSSTFNIPFVQKAVKDVLDYRPDIVFLFLSTDKFIEHERVIFVPFIDGEQEKYNHIHACDAMIHARADGETFGLSVGEFSACSKPVITWSGEYQGQRNPNYDTCHIELLGKRAIIYKDYKEALEILYSIKRAEIPPIQWDVYTDRFSEKNVMDQFNKVFLL